MIMLFFYDRTYSAAFYLFFRSDTELEISTVLPDTITTWITNAFVISENLGFGILESPVQVFSFSTENDHVYVATTICQGF